MKTIRRYLYLWRMEMIGGGVEFSYRLRSRGYRGSCSDSACDPRAWVTAESRGRRAVWCSRCPRMVQRFLGRQAGSVQSGRDRGQAEVSRSDLTDSLLDSHPRCPYMEDVPGQQRPLLEKCTHVFPLACELHYWHGYNYGSNVWSQISREAQ